MNNIYQEQAEITELVGADDWAMVVDSFKNMTAKEIEVECEKMWPSEDDSKEFAQRVYEAVN